MADTALSSRVVRLAGSDDQDPGVYVAGYKIEDVGPPPPAQKKRAGDLYEAMAALAVDQSLLLKDDYRHQRALDCARKFTDGRKFTTRKTRQGIRVWRTE